MVLKPSEILKPGMVIVVTRRKGEISPIGTLNETIEGDSVADHVCLMLPNGKIGTTGAESFVLYGEVDPDEYLQGKTVYLLETVDPLTAGQLAIIQACHNEMLHSGLARLYGGWKIPYLLCLELFTGSPQKTGLKPKLTRPSCPICDQAAGYPLWKAGVEVGESVGKLDWTALSPDIYLKEGQQTAFDLAKGWLQDKGDPCYLLRTVQDKPFIF